MKNGEFGFNVSQMVLGQLGLIYDKLLDYASHNTKKFLQTKNISFNNEVDELIRLMKKIRLNSLTVDEIDTDINEKFNFEILMVKSDSKSISVSATYFLLGIFSIN